jgi:hypothetical protein
MTLYQRRDLATQEDIGEPGPLPDNLRGSLTDEDLEHLSDLNPAPEYDGQGFFRVADPEPAPAPVRWIHKAIYLRRFTAAERIAIFAARGADPILNDLLYVLESAENVFLDDPDLVNGLGYLVAQGHLDPERPAQILA